MPFDRIAAAIAGGEVEAGVLIHEELLHCAESGVEKQECLGRRWCEETGLPLPIYTPSSTTTCPPSGAGRCWPGRGGSTRCSRCVSPTSPAFGGRSRSATASCGGSCPGRWETKCRYEMSGDVLRRILSAELDPAAAPTSRATR